MRVPVAASMGRVYVRRWNNSQGSGWACDLERPTRPKVERGRKSPMEGLPSGERNSQCFGAVAEERMCGLCLGQCKPGMMRKSSVSDSNPRPQTSELRDGHGTAGTVKRDGAAEDTN